MHVHPVHIDMATYHPNARGGMFYKDGKRMPFQVGTIKLPKGTLFFEYVLTKAIDYEDDEELMFMHIRPEAQFKSSVYPDTVMEFSL